MKKGTKQLIAGGAGCLGLVSSFVIGAPTLMMLGVGIGCFAAVQMLIEADLDPHEVKFSGGVTGEDILRVTTQIDDAVRFIQELAQEVPDFGATLVELADVLNLLRETFGKDPGALTRASSFPTYLRMVESSLGGYRELHRLPVRTKDWETSLRNTEATTGTVVMAFRQLVVDLSDQKRTSLEVDTNTLRRLLGEAAQQYTASALPKPDAPSASAQTGANHESAATGRRGALCRRRDRSGLMVPAHHEARAEPTAGKGGAGAKGRSLYPKGRRGAERWLHRKPLRPFGYRLLNEAGGRHTVCFNT